MISSIPKEVFEAIAVNYTRTDKPAEILSVEKIGNGLINHSWKLEFTAMPALFLQCINQVVFTDPFAIQNNYMRLWEHKAGFRLPEPFYFSPGQALFRDPRGDYWRAFSFIPGTVSFSTAASPAMATETALAFAGFTAAFCRLDLRQLATVIPAFHDLGKRFSGFKASLETPAPGRETGTEMISRELLGRENYVTLFSFIRDSGLFPERVMHHDAKIGNVLFDADTGKLSAVVDYDTVMPGFFYSDLGDLVRSMTCQEDENNNGVPVIRKDFYEAIINGYTEGLDGVLTTDEKKWIHAPGLLLTYMQALRFLTDHHLGDLYYQVQYPGQNLERARNQFGLLKGLEQFLSEAYGFTI